MSQTQTIPQVLVTPRPSASPVYQRPLSSEIGSYPPGSPQYQGYPPQPYGESLPSGQYEPMRKDCDIWSNPIQCPIIIYTFLIVIGLVINLILLSMSPNFNRNGQPVSTGLKWNAAVLGTGFTVLFALIFGAWINYLCISCRHINGWIVFLVALLFPIILTYFDGLIMGEWMSMGHLWAVDPIIPLRPTQ